MPSVLCKELATGCRGVDWRRTWRRERSGLSASVESTGVRRTVAPMARLGFRRRVDRSSENDVSWSATRKSLFLTSKSKMLARKSLFLIADVEPRKCFYRPRSNARPASGLIDATGKIVVSVIGDEVSGVLCTCRFRVWAQAHRQHGPPNCGRNGSGGFGPAGDP